jgi:hypothetical protein
MKEMMIHGTIGMNLEDIMQREINQTQKDKILYDFPLGGI